jgi:excisionase family DNA binding protein
MSRAKDVLTTGEVAKICNVAPRTVSKWFDSGQLRGYRIPGSRDRRIPLAQLIRFMKAHGIPLNGLETGQTRVLVIDDEVDLTDLLQRSLNETEHYEVQVAASALEAGAMLERFRPNAVLVDVDLPGLDSRALGRFIAGRAEFQGTQLIATGASITDADRQRLRQQGFTQTIAKPFTIRQVMDAIEEAAAIFT